jgi:hypothetical protein
MTQALHGEAFTRHRNKPAKGRDETAAEASKSSVTYTLKVLSTTPDDARRTVLFQRLGEGEAIEISAEIDSPNLLARLPDFLDAALEIQKALWPAQRTVSSLPSSFFPRIAAESRLLRSLSWGAASTHPTPAIERLRAVREAVIVRDVAWEALRDVLGPKRRGEIDALVVANETPAALADSMDAIAAYLDRMLADPRDAAILAVTDLDAAYSLALRRAAAILHAQGDEAAPETPDPPRRRGLLRLIGMAYRALGTEAFMTVPALQSLTYTAAPRPARPPVIKPGLRKTTG